MLIYQLFQKIVWAILSNFEIFTISAMWYVDRKRCKFHN